MTSLPSMPPIFPNGVARSTPLLRRRSVNYHPYRKKGKGAGMKIIAVEEHFQIAAIKKAVGSLTISSQMNTAMAAPPSDARLEDMGADRLHAMDATGIDVQVLSITSPGTQVLPPSEAVPLARDANDQLAAAIAAHPDRFAGFA